MATRLSVLVALALVAASAGASAEPGCPQVSPYALLGTHLAGEPGPPVECLGYIAVRVAGEPREWAFVWDRDGHLVHVAAGEPHRVRIPVKLLPLLRGAVLLHNHPGGTQRPTSVDCQSVVRLGAARSVVVWETEGAAHTAELTPVAALRCR